MAAKNLKAEVDAVLNPPDPVREAAVQNAAVHATAALPGVARKITDVPLGLLRASPTNPRKTFANMESLVASIKSIRGVLVPLICREIEADGQKVVEVVAGERRMRAAKLAKLETVPCDIRELDDTQVEEIQITENLQREDISDLEEAEAFESLMEKRGYTADQIAKRFGVSVGTVYSRVKLLALAGECREALAEGKISSSVAVPLARIPSKKLQVDALKTLVGGSYQVSTAREAINWLQREFCISLRGAPFDLKDEMLVKDAGSCKACPKNSGCATPGLFDDFAKGAGAFCTDTACFRQKSAASWKAVAAQAEAKGALVLTLEEGARLYQYENLAHGSKYTELDQPNHADSKKRTWREFYERLPEDQRPRLIVSPDRAQAPHELVETSALVAALAESPSAPKWAKAEVERKEEKREEAADSREARAAEKLRTRVAHAAVAKIGAGLKKLDEVTLRFILLGLADRWVPQQVLEATGAEDHDAFEKKVTKGTLPELFAMLLAWGAFSGDLLEMSEGYPDALKKLAKVHEVDLKQIEKAIEAGDEAEALMTKKGGK